MRFSIIAMVAVLALLVLLAFAYIDGGRERLEWIEQELPVATAGVNP